MDINIEAGRLFAQARQYSPAVTMVVIAALISFTSGPLFALGLLFLLCLSIFQISRYVQRCDEATEKIRRLNMELCRSQNISHMDELSAGVGHEINNPLGIMAQEIEWATHLLKSNAGEELRDKEELEDSLREIASQIDRCKEIVRKLLSLAQDLEPIVQLIDVNELMVSLSAVVQHQASTQHIKINQNYAKGVPHIYTDPPLLRQVVLNLIVNAIHAVNSDGWIDLTTHLNENKLEIIVKDSGCGIPAENMTKIFTPFFSTKTQGKGTGLGLALCRGIIERLGGDIFVTSKLGEGSVFTIQLPLTRAT